MKGTFVIGALVISTITAASVLGQRFGWSAGNSSIESLLAVKTIRTFLTEAPEIAIAYPPLGTVLLSSLGAGLMAASGLLDAIARALSRSVPAALLSPAVFILGLCAHQISDALYVVYLPLCGLIFHLRGRSPVLGVMVGFAAFSGALNAGFFPGLQDIVLFGITDKAVVATRLGGGPVYPVATLWFSMANAVVLTLVAWAIADGLLARRIPAPPSKGAGPGLEPALDRNGLFAAGLAALVAFAVFGLLTVMPDYAPLADATATGIARFAPAYHAGAAILTTTTAAAGLAYGFASGRWTCGEDVGNALRKALIDLSPFLLMGVFIAFIIKAIDISNLGRIAAFSLGSLVRSGHWPTGGLAALLMTITAAADFLLFSASAKWTILAPSILPAMAEGGVSPAFATTAFRAGDAVVNIVNPLQPAAVYALISAAMWDRTMTMGRFLRPMIFFMIAFFGVGMAMLLLWAALALPLGPM